MTGTGQKPTFPVVPLSQELLFTRPPPRGELLLRDASIAHVLSTDVA